MERVDQDRSVLRDLALVYLALAHSTDEQLDESEVDIIAHRLRAWQAEVEVGTAVGAIKNALEDYVHNGAREEVQAAIRHLRTALPHDRRQVIVDDLVDIAMADDKFLHEEGAFITELAHAWEVHVADGAGDHARQWCILCPDGQDGQWTAIHDLAVVYLTLAQQTDDDLSTVEVEAITRKISEWLPDAREVDVEGVVQEAMSVYAQGPDERIFNTSVKTLQKAVPRHQRAALLDDLRYVANADGVILDKEREMIGALARAWSLNLEEVGPEGTRQNGV